MDTWLIIIGAYTVCVISWLIFIFSKNVRKKINFKDAFEVALVIVSTIIAPLSWVLGLVLIIVDKKKNPGFPKPKPLPKKLRAGLKKDRVLFDGKVMSIAEVNRYTGKNYSLEDVYGRKYVASLSEEDRREFDDGIGTISVADSVNKDDPTYKVIRRFAEARKEGRMEPVRDLFDPEVSLVLYGKETFHGVDDVLFYWQDRHRRLTVDKVKCDYEVIPCMFYNGIALEESPQRYARMIILFRFREGKIVQMTFAPLLLNYKMPYYGSFREVPYLTSYYSQYFTGDLESRADHVPCPFCGETSENLEWHSFDHYDYTHSTGMRGVVSVCPHCGCTVEINPSEQYERTEEDRERHPKPLFEDAPKHAAPQMCDNDFLNIAWSFIGQGVESLINRAADKEEAPVSDILKTYLPHISAPKGRMFVLSLASCEHDDHGDVSQIKLVPEGLMNQAVYGFAEEEIIPNLLVDRQRTELAAWELYLLCKSPNLLPTYWHGGYARKDILFGLEDLKTIPSQRGHALGRVIHGDDLKPKVSVDGDTATVSCCTWSEWGGLYRETMKIVFDGDRVKSFEFARAKNLYKYDCGIMF